MRLIFSIFLIIGLFSCKKASDRACVKSIGNVMVIENDLADFNHLYLGPHLRFNLVQDTINKIKIKGGENVISFVKTDFIDGRLHITNENKCNFLRSYKKKIEVELHVKKLQNIEFDATEPVFCENTIITDYLSVTINESAGRFHLDLNAEVLYTVVNKNWGNFELNGAVNFYKVNLGGNAFGDATGLSVMDSIHVISRSGRDLDINANGVLLRSQLFSTGNVGYIGTPSLIDHTSFDEGELVNKN